MNIFDDIEETTETAETPKAVVLEKADIFEQLKPGRSIDNTLNITNFVGSHHVAGSEPLIQEAGLDAEVVPVLQTGFVVEGFVDAEVVPVLQTDFVVTTATRIIEIKKAIEAQKALYEELEGLVLALKAHIGTDNELSVGGQHLLIVDNFAEKNTVYRPAAVKRFDLKMVSFEDRVESEAKAAKKTAKKAK